MRKLDDAGFQATFSRKMLDVEPDSPALADLFALIPTIPAADLDGFALPNRPAVERVYQGDSGLFEHYLIPTTTANVYLVLVRDRPAERFFAFHVINLNAKYGLPTPPPADPGGVP